MFGRKQLVFILLLVVLPTVVFGQSGSARTFIGVRACGFLNQPWLPRGAASADGCVSTEAVCEFVNGVGVAGSVDNRLNFNPYSKTISDLQRLLNRENNPDRRADLTSRIGELNALRRWLDPVCVINTTAVPTISLTNVPTVTPLVSRTTNPTVSRSPTPSLIPTTAPTPTFTVTASPSPVLPTATSTHSPTITATATSTSTPTRTPTPTPLIPSGEFKALFPKLSGTPIAVKTADLDGDSTPEIIVLTESPAQVLVFKRNAEGTYSLSNQRDVTAGSIALAVGKLDNNSRPDVAVTNGATPLVEILLAGADAVLAPPVTITITGCTSCATDRDIAIADMDKDGNGDVIISRKTANYVSVFTGVGDGINFTVADYPTGSSTLEYPEALAIADVNGDEFPDIITANMGSDDFSILFSTGNASSPFSTFSKFPCSSGLVDLAVDDINFDGNNDLIGLLEGPSEICISLSGGGGSFLTPGNVPVTTTQSPSRIALGKIDSDGILDAVVLDPAGRLRLLNGDSGGNLAIRTNSVDLDSAPVDLAVDDLDGNGRDDIVVVNKTSKTLAILYGDGDNRFLPPTSLQAGDGATTMAIGDLNKDKLEDVVVSNLGSDSISIFYNQGNRTFAAAANFTVGDGPWGITIGDVNGDANPDIFVSNSLGNTVSRLIGNVSGGFNSLPPIVLTPGAGPRGLHLINADQDSSAIPELVVALHGSAMLAVLKGNLGASPTPVATPLYYDPLGQPERFVYDHLNGDADLDLAVVLPNNNKIAVFTGALGATFNAHSNLYPASTPQSATIIDVGGEGKRDVVSANLVDKSFSIFLNASTNTFSGITTVKEPNLIFGPASITHGKLDSDAIEDLILGDRASGAVLTLKGVNGATYSAPVRYYIGEEVRDVLTADFDNDGLQDIIGLSAGTDSAAILWGLPQ